MIPRMNKSPLAFMQSTNNHNLFLYPITQTEIKDEINALNSSKAVGPCSIPVNILKLLQDFLIIPSSITSQF